MLRYRDPDKLRFTGPGSAPLAPGPQLSTTGPGSAPQAPAQHNGPLLRVRTTGPGSAPRARLSTMGIIPLLWNNMFHKSC